MGTTQATTKGPHVMGDHMPWGTATTTTVDPSSQAPSLEYVPPTVERPVQGKGQLETPKTARNGPQGTGTLY